MSAVFAHPDDDAEGRAVVAGSVPGAYSPSGRRGRIPVIQRSRRERLDSDLPVHEIRKMRGARQD